MRLHEITKPYDDWKKKYPEYDFDIKNLYRGMSDSHITNFNGLHRGIIRKDRIPSNSSPILNQLANDVIYKNTNEHNVRNKSLFCSLDYSTANIYGTVVNVYPELSSSFIYSPVIYDLFSGIGKLIRNAYKVLDMRTRYTNRDEIILDIKNEGKYEELVDEISKITKYVKLPITELHSLKTNNEIMIIGDTFMFSNDEI